MSYKKDSLGDRMKTYEKASRARLTNRTPVILRLDGCHFHTLTKKFARPFDEKMTFAMQETMLYLCKNIQGCVLGYTQSDEITLVLVDYKTLNTTPWYDNQVQKICSVAASMATYAFNECMRNFDEEYHAQAAHFDCRCFNLPKEEVNNCLVWRQQDAIRNSIQSVGQFYYSHKELHKKNQKKILEMLEEKGIDWKTFPPHLQRGSCCIRMNNFIFHETDGTPVTRAHWEVYKHSPIFSERPEFVNNLIYYNPDKEI